MTALQRPRAALLAMRDMASRPTARRWLLLAAAALFAAMAISSFRALPDDREPIRPVFMVASALIAAPGTLLLNALEYRAIAKAAGHQVDLGKAARVSLTASLANLLPAPGAVAVRTAALKQEGSSIGAALSVNATAGIVWMGTTAGLMGLALLTDATYAGRGLLIGLAGAGALAVSALMLRRRSPGWRRVFGELVLIETGATLVAALRVWLSFTAIGQPESLAAVVTVSAAQILAAAVGIFPGGLGLREAIAAGLAATVQVPAAVAVAGSAVDRVSVQAGMALCAPVLGIRLGKLVRRTAQGDEDRSPVTLPSDVDQIELRLTTASLENDDRTGS